MRCNTPFLLLLLVLCCCCHAGGQQQSGCYTQCTVLSGLAGPQGLQGVQGLRGVQGFNGTQGVQGVVGPQGGSGTQGVAGPTGTQGIQGMVDVLLLEDQQKSRMPASLSVGGTWTPLPLNSWSTAKPWYSLLTKGSLIGQFLLAGPASYYLVARGSAASVRGHQLRLFNLTGNSTLAYGSAGFASSALPTLGHSALYTYLTVPTGQSLFRLEYYTALTGALGWPLGAPDAVEVYLQVQVVKLDHLDTTNYTLNTPVTGLAPVYGSVYLTATQAVAVAPALVFDHMSVGKRVGYSDMLDATRVWIQVGGVYVLSATAQISGAAGASLDLWLRVNGGDVPSSCHSAYLVGASDVKVLGMGFFLPTLTAGDYLEVAWRSSDNNTVVQAQLANAIRPVNMPGLVLALHQSGAAYASLASNATAVAPSVTAVNLVAFNTTGASLASFTASNTSPGPGTRLTATLAGVFVVTFAAHLSGATATVEVWLRVDGVNVVDSNTRWSLSSAADFKAAKQVFVVALNAGSYVEVAWCTSSTTAVMRAASATTLTPARPSVTLVLAQLPSSSLVYLHASHTLTLSPTGANIPTLVLFNTNDTLSTGWGRTPSSRFSVPVSGVYYIAIGAHTSGASLATFDLWLRVNGVDVPYSAASNTLPLNTEVKLVSRSDILRLVAGDFVELAWRCSAAGGTLLALAAQINPVRPATPSARLSLYLVSTE